jgi:uncharacterized protein with PIN domain
MTDGPARLNSGDCFADGLAKETHESLPFTGNAFASTGVEPVIRACFDG